MASARVRSAASAACLWTPCSASCSKCPTWTPCSASCSRSRSHAPDAQLPFMRDAMDQMAQNPDMLRTMLQSDPRMREVLERNPELNHALNDPEMLRRTFDAARNPELMREQMRLADRAFANVEAHPGGFNALSRMHQDVHEPMMNALSGGGESGRGGGGGGAAATADNPFAQMFAQNPPAGGAATNAPSTNTPSTNTPSSAPTAAPRAPSAGPAATRVRILSRRCSAARVFGTPARAGSDPPSRRTRCSRSSSRCSPTPRCSR